MRPSRKLHVALACSEIDHAYLLITIEGETANDISQTCLVPVIDQKEIPVKLIFVDQNPRLAYRLILSGLSESGQSVAQRHEGE